MEEEAPIPCCWWLWPRPAVAAQVALIGPLAWELTNATGAAVRKTKKRKKG